MGFVVDKVARGYPLYSYVIVIPPVLLPVGSSSVVLIMSISETADLQHENKHERRCKYNVTLRRVHVTIVAVGKE